MSFPIVQAKSRKSLQSQDYIAGLGKGMAILECFDSERQRLSVTAAAEKTGITRASARRHLLTLQHLGYLGSDGQYFYLTPKILKFSSAYLNSSTLTKIAQPLLNLLTLQTGNTCSIMVLDELEAITIVRGFIADANFKPHRITPYGINLGHRLPAYATSAGKILLAHLTIEEIEVLLNKYTLKPFTKNTITDRDILIQQLVEIKQQQWCYAREEHELSIHAIAVPVINSNGQVVAALNMVVPTYGNTELMLKEEMLPLLYSVANEIRFML